MPKYVWIIMIAPDLMFSPKFYVSYDEAFKAAQELKREDPPWPTARPMRLENANGG